LKRCLKQLHEYNSKLPQCPYCNKDYHNLETTKIVKNKRSAEFRKSPEGKRYFEHYAENYRQRKKELRRARVQNNPEKYALNRRKCYLKDKTSSYLARSKRRALKAKAMPKWLSLEDIEEIRKIYAVCSWLNAWKIEKFHVDHIIPLKNDLICGLHVPWNLQIISAKENLQKGNKLLDI